MKIIVRSNGLKGPILYKGTDMDDAVCAAREYNKYRHLTNDILGVRIVAGNYLVHNWQPGPFGEEPEDGLRYEFLLNKWKPFGKKVSGKRRRP